MPGTVDFYGGPFSNFAHSPILLLDPWGVFTEYDTVEHYFAAHKATTQEEHYYIVNADGPSEAKKRGRKVGLRPDWEDVKYDVMLNGLRAKFDIPYYRKCLLATGECEIREDSPADYVWGYRNGGQNLLGKALMQIRDEIRSAERIW